MVMQEVYPPNALSAILRLRGHPPSIDAKIELLLDKPRSRGILMG
jgi:hypothetical protein